MNRIHSLALVAVVAVITIIIRFLPFAVFGKGTPKQVLYLSRVLPYAIMGMLVVYCLRGCSFTEAPHALPEILSCALVVLLHKWKHNTLLSIAAGTAFYMMLVQAVF